MDNNGRYTHIEDVLINLHDGQWFSWSDPYNKVYANLKLSEKMGVDGKLVDNPYTLPHEKELTEALAKQQADFDAQAYARNRKAEYDALNQLEMQFDDKEDGTTTWEDAIKAIKKKYPKG